MLTGIMSKNHNRRGHPLHDNAENRCGEACFAILPTENSLVIFFCPLEKLGYLTGKGLFVHSARLTVREIPLMYNRYKSSLNHNSVRW